MVKLEPRLCKVKDAAKILGVSKDWLYRQIGKQQFPYVRFSPKSTRIDLKIIKLILEKSGEFYCPHCKEKIELSKGGKA